MANEFIWDVGAPDTIHCSKRHLPVHWVDQKSLSIVHSTLVARGPTWAQGGGDSCLVSGACRQQAVSRWHHDAALQTILGPAASAGCGK